jgi:sulfur-oxidizing protein SoxY
MSKSGTFAPSRRRALSLGAGAIGALALNGSPAPAYEENDATERIRRFTAGKRPIWGKVKLDLPEIAENSNAIRMEVSVESSMTESEHVTDVLVVTDGNSRAGVATFHFSPASGVARVTTFIRLSSKQNVIAVARMNDGSFYMAIEYVRVSIGGCCS